MNQTRNELLDGALQLLEHCRRCGVTSIPKPNDGWMNAWSSASEIAALSTPVKNDGRSSPSISAQSEPTVSSSAANLSKRSEGPTPVAPAFSSEAKRPVAANLLEVSQGEWSKPPLVTAERAEVFRILSQDVSDCIKCHELACSRKQIVFGAGSLHPRVVLFGEAPGAEEDRLGEPFVGPAGQLLNKIIVAAKMKREEVYILNSLKCRPPGNRTPVDEEIANCRPFFEKQLDVLQPEYIVCLGAVAARAVLQTTESVGRLRGRFHRYRTAKVLVTYHPSYLLRNEGAKKFVWEDMQSLMRDMGLM